MKFLNFIDEDKDLQILFLMIYIPIIFTLVMVILGSVFPCSWWENIFNNKLLIPLYCLN